VEEKKTDCLFYEKRGDGICARYGGEEKGPGGITYRIREEESGLFSIVSRK